MPRIRSIKPDTWDDVAVGEVSREARLLFVGLITQADDDGRLPGHARWIIGKIYPYDSDLKEADVDGWLGELAIAGLVHRYTNRERPYLELPAWEENQSIDGRYYKPSRLPGREDDGSALVNPSPVAASAPGDGEENDAPDRIGEERIGEDRRGVVERDDAPLSHLLADLVAENDPNGKRPNVLARWAHAERLMVERDGRDPEQAERLIRWCQADDFWRGNVKSMPKFRERYPTLYDHARRNGNGESKASRRAREILGGADTIDGSAEEVAA